MGHVNFHYKKKYLDIHDVRLMILFRFLARKGRELYHQNIELSEVFNKWDYAIDWSAPGVVDLRLEEFLEEKEEHTKIFQNLLDEVEKETKAFDDFIPQEYVNKFFEHKTNDSVGMGMDYPVKTQLGIIQQFRDLVKVDEETKA